MKQSTLSLAAMLLLAITLGYAQPYFPRYESYCDANLDRAAQRYALSLESSNEGIVMSALAHIGRIKLYFPEKSFPEVEKKVAELSLSGQTTNIRYRAFLISNVLSSPKLFVKEAQTQYDDGDALFSALAYRLDSTVLGSISAQ